jgi:hypothetical protein
MGGKGNREEERDGEGKEEGDISGYLPLLTKSQQSTSAAMTIEWVFMRVLTTVQKALWELTVPVRGEGVEGVPGLPRVGGSEKKKHITTKQHITLAE